MSKVVIRTYTVTKDVGMLEKIGLSSPRSLSSLQAQIKSSAHFLSSSPLIPCG
jgi:hypothetical protein